MGLFNSYFEQDKFYYGEAWFPLQLAFNIGLSFSQLLNSILAGCPDETISSRFGRCKLDPDAPKWSKKVCVFIDFVFGPEHCKSAVEYSLSRQKELWHISSKTDYPKPAPRVRGF